MTQTSEQMLFELGNIKSKEKIKRQITSIVPTRITWGETCLDTIAGRIREGKITHHLKQNTDKMFDESGVIDLIENPQTALDVVREIAMCNYSIDNYYLSDIAAGLYTMVTTGQGLYDVKNIKLGDRRVGFAVTTSLKTLYLAAFGPLVNNNGYALHGAGNIIKKGKEAILKIISGRVAMPRAYASIKRNGKEFTVEGEPIHVYRRAGDTVIIFIDHYYYPGVLVNGEYTAQDQYTHRVAGQTAFLQLGSKIVNKGRGRSTINIKTAIKILNVAQACFELDRFCPGVVKRAGGLKQPVEVLLRRTSLKDIYPDAIEHGRPNFAKLNTAVQLTRDYFRAAMNKTGIADDLLKIKTKQGEPAILIPGDRMRIQDDLPNTAFMAVDRI